MRRSGGTVNERHAIKEQRAEHGTRHKVLERSFACIQVFTAKSHQGVNREARQFHAQEKGEKVDRLGHERCTTSRKQQKRVSFAALELFVTESPLKARNAEECAKENRGAENAANRVHRIQVHERVVRREEIGTGTEQHKEACHPRKHLVLVFVLEERFCSKRHECAHCDKNYRQEIHDITHFQKPPLHWPRFVQMHPHRRLRFRSFP